MEWWSADGQSIVLSVQARLREAAFTQNETRLVCMVRPDAIQVWDVAAQTLVCSHRLFSTEWAAMYGHWAVSRKGLLAVADHGRLHILMLDDDANAKSINVPSVTGRLHIADDVCALPCQRVYFAVEGLSYTKALYTFVA